MRCQPPGEPLRARLRFNRLFQTADLWPSGFSPHSILIVRRLSAPQKISLDSLRLRTACEREIREAITLHLRRAIRPIMGRIPADADALLFQDVGEWLACLARATRLHEVERHWCWRAMLTSRAHSSTHTLTQVWSERARFIPAAIIYLARWRESARVLQMFSPTESNRMLSALSAEFDLPQRSPASTTTRTALPPNVAHRPYASQTSASQPRTNAAADSFAPSTAESSKVAIEERPAVSVISRGSGATEPTASSPMSDEAKGSRIAPWRLWIPDAETACESLPPATQHLLAVSVELFHAPACARTASFRAKVTAWLERKTVIDSQTPTEMRAAQVLEEEVAAYTSMEAHAEVTSEDKEQTTRAVNSAAEKESGTANQTQNDELIKEEMRPAVVESHAPPASSSSLRKTNEELYSEAEAERAQPLSASLSADALTTDSAVEARSAQSEELSAWKNFYAFETKLGGVLYLVNIFAQLGLPECFDEDFRLSEYLSGWGLADLLAHELLGSLNEAYDDDPLWQLLAQLDGRVVGEAPGAGFQCGESYRMPARWLKVFKLVESSWQMSIVKGRLVISHPTEHFIIVERPLQNGSFTELADEEARGFEAQGIKLRLHESAAFAPRKALTQTFTNAPQPPDDLQRWMRWTFPFLSYLLQHKLSEEAQETEALARLLLIKRGRIFCTQTHLDLLMSMDEINLAVRRAGLDVSPGWMRDLVRVVTFHFE
jgi:hypothetical protein